MERACGVQPHGGMGLVPGAHQGHAGGPTGAFFFFFFQAGACKHQGAGAALGGVRRVEQDVKAVSALWVVLGKSLQCRQAPGSDRGSSARLLAEGSAPRVEI